MALPSLKDTRLVGGTALSLLLGHRHSVDIDLFGISVGDESELEVQILSLGEIVEVRKTASIYTWLINGIKVDIVRYPYPWIDDMINEKSLRIAGIKDIIAMKLAAVTGRGSKKDFFDIYFLLKKFCLKEMVELYLEKYKNASTFLLIKSLGYFKDADQDDEPFMIKRINWLQVKSAITKELNKYVTDNR